MTTGQDRKAAVTAYKERKVSAGVYALRCVATGKVWVGAAPDLSTIQNRLWFQLKQNCSPNRDLQAIWNEHGADNLSFEILERLEEETLVYAQRAALKKRVQHWRETLDAAVL
ncbi:GIY-YIG nuclease family protein [Azospirillum brasilense]|uniref:GIY-YIG nuclease family protein n=1 Tax=Azospirillum brasilense TaxID=192 RepID=A0A0P0FF04_AZOBR|nr:GIY-YIG nuclease family protein [Azospirillum brasilense]PWC86468.1 hypothetical protein AEJ54_26920 [Azospirillum sp. Sp 7]ALJ38842.1 hypothetical protein AMK58_25395 [Azospirillum brasilense]NUB29088.1 GIY-YIG nuclease family protein [Azospirillum brasilense]NUB32625.1 GIY-YIG nuclease family protein [Azospirillum brasilense]OPH13381.1 hypothetical protein FE89_22625 [Azospirillum brasilense]